MCVPVRKSDPTGHNNINSHIEIFPMLFALHYQDVFNPSKVLNGAAVSPSTKMASLADGVLLLTQYDEMISATVFLCGQDGCV